MPGPDLRKLYQTLLKQSGKQGGVYRKDSEGNAVPVQYFAGGNNEQGYIGDTEKSKLSTTEITDEKPYWLQAKEYYKENHDKSIDRINSTPAYLKMMGDDISRKIREEEDRKGTEWGKNMANPNYGTNPGEVMIGDNNPFKRTIIGQLSSDVGMKNRAERFTGSKHKFYDPNMEGKSDNIDFESVVQPMDRSNIKTKSMSQYNKEKFIYNNKVKKKDTHTVVYKDEFDEFMNNPFNKKEDKKKMYDLYFHENNIGNGFKVDLNGKNTPKTDGVKGYQDNINIPTKKIWTKEEVRNTPFSKNDETILGNPSNIVDTNKLFETHKMLNDPNNFLRINPKIRKPKINIPTESIEGKSSSKYKAYDFIEHPDNINPDNPSKNHSYYIDPDDFPLRKNFNDNIDFTKGKKPPELKYGIRYFRAQK